MTAPKKRDVRHAARARRARLAAALEAEPGRREAAAEAIATTVLRFVPDRARVAAYVSLPDEPPTDRLIEALIDAGHEVIVPVVLEDWSLQWTYAAAGAVGDRATVTRRPRDTHDGSEAGWLGLDALSTCDLVVTPGLSVDRHGTRLGQGGGCYDRALVHRDAAAPVITLLHEGEASETDLPRAAHDVPVDGWVTTTGRLVRVTAPVSAPVPDPSSAPVTEPSSGPVTDPGSSSPTG